MLLTVLFLAFAILFLKACSEHEEKRAMRRSEKRAMRRSSKRAAKRKDLEK